jgi:hypothetical protein
MIDVAWFVRGERRVDLGWISFALLVDFWVDFCVVLWVILSGLLRELMGWLMGYHRRIR